MATLQEILADAQYGDTLEVSFGDKGKATLGEMRQLKRQIDAERIAYEAKRKEADGLTEEAAKLLAGLNEAAAKNKNAASKTEGYDWKSDPLYAPVVAEIAGVMAEAKRAIELSEAQKKSFEQISSVYAFERMRSEYDRSGYKDKPFEELAQQAIASKHFDRFGLPTLEPTINRLTEPTRIKAAQDEAVKAAKIEWEAAQQAAAAAPGRGGAARITTQKAATQAPPNKRIEDITSEMVAADPDVQAAMRGEQVQ